MSILQPDRRAPNFNNNTNLFNQQMDLYTVPDLQGEKKLIAKHQDTTASTVEKIAMQRRNLGNTRNDEDLRACFTTNQYPGMERVKPLARFSIYQDEPVNGSFLHANKPQPYSLFDEVPYHPTQEQPFQLFDRTAVYSNKFPDVPIPMTEKFTKQIMPPLPLAPGQIVQTGRGKLMGVAVNQPVSLTNKLYARSSQQVKLQATQTNFYDSFLWQRCGIIITYQVKILILKLNMMYKIIK